MTQLVGQGETLPCEDGGRRCQDRHGLVCPSTEAVHGITKVHDPDIHPEETVDLGGQVVGQMHLAADGFARRERQSLSVRRPLT
ncbi:hypothetical protein [Janibacter hoylei]|uniref:hypothetical protein n=1 Tax=Janibacter hoylei TaxID=364298 RepID=UPI0006918768|nr:hypothetical protein [Janibacter hoylei]